MLDNTRNYTADSYVKLMAVVGDLSDVTDIWSALAKMWREHPDFKDHDVFHDAVHTVMWGIVPKRNYSAEYQELIWAVADVMENCDEALEVWRELNEYIRARNHVEAEMDPDSDDDVIYRHTIIHYRYLANRLMSKLEYERCFCTEPDEDSIEQWRGYEASIVHIIPDAAGWSRMQWGDENNIHDELLISHGVDYRDRIDEFDRVMLLKMGYDGKGEVDSESAWYAMNIQCLPYSLAEVFWPNNTKDIIRKLFVKAVEYTLEYERIGKPDFEKKDLFIHATGIFDRKDLLESWIYKLCVRWCHGNVFCGHEGYELKKAIFNISVQ